MFKSLPCLQILAKAVGGMRERVTEGKHIYANNADVHGNYVDSVDKHFGHIYYAPN